MVFELLLGALLGLLVLLGAYRWKRRHIYRLAASLSGPPTVPLFGNLDLFLGDSEHISRKILPLLCQFKSPFRLWMGPKLYVVVFEPDDLQAILNNPKGLEKDFVYKFFKNTVGEGLFTAPVDKWKKTRRKIMPALSKKQIENFMPIFNQQNKIMTSKLEKMLGKGIFDIRHFIELMNFDVLCGSMLGVEMDSQHNPKSEFFRDVLRVSELDYLRIFKIWLYPDFIFNRLSYAKELKEAYKQVHGLPNKVIKEKKDEYNKLKQEVNANELFDDTKDHKPKNVLDILLELSENGAMFSDEDLKNEVVTLMIGGSETIAYTNSFCCLMLAIHHEIQEKAYNEIQSVFEDSYRDATTEDLAQLSYLEQIINETMRLFPIGPFFARSIKEDLPISSCVLPAGCSVIMSPLILHMQANIYPEPHKFDPERFTVENIASRHKYSFLPFSGGPRGCIGARYAMISMKVTISNLLRKYRLFTDCKMEDVKIKFDLLLRSKNGYPVQIEKRKKPVE